MYEDNGVLGRVPGQYLSRGSAHLPPPEAASPDTWVAVDAEAFGAYRVLFRVQLMRHQRHRHWAWLPVYAEVA